MAFNLYDPSSDQNVRLRLLDATTSGSKRNDIGCLVFSHSVLTKPLSTSVGSRLDISYSHSVLTKPLSTSVCWKQA